jgi:hypothetical protein
LVSAFHGKTAKAGIKAQTKVTVGFKAEYSVVVHEDMERFHPNGQAKFLETPMRIERAAMGQIVRIQMNAGKTLPEALQVAGEYLLGKAKERVPVLTGFLRDSGFVSVE